MSRAGRDPRRRFELTRDAASRAARERFRDVWNASVSAAEAATALGLVECYVLGRARELREAGLTLKRMPPRKTPAP